jgi:hypothetical protein
MTSMSMDEQMDKFWNIEMVEYYSAI